MNFSTARKELDAITERAEFLRAVIASAKPKYMPIPYVCQQYDQARLCRFDRRAIDRKCDGCKRVTDRDYLNGQGLWIDGISHA